MKSSTFANLEEWYASHCDGDWEHGAGINIVTLDNPGRRVTINLAGTDLESAHFSEVSHNEISQTHDSNQEWYICRKNGTEFVGIGGPKQLSTVLQIFADWSRLVAEQSAV